MKPKTPTQRSRECRERQKNDEVQLTFDIPKTKVTEVTQAVERIIKGA